MELGALVLLNHFEFSKNFLKSGPGLVRGVTVLSLAISYFFLGGLPPSPYMNIFMYSHL